MSVNQEKELEAIFTKEHTKYFKNNKHEITHELLETLREYGNPGKLKCLEILELEKDESGYYLDAFGNQISYKKNPSLKGINVKLPITQIHIDEIQRCSEDIYYFLQNYCRIVTQKGVTFPDLREYQVDFIRTILPDEHESIVALMPRQAGKSVTVSVYFCWLALFEKDVNIGVAAQNTKLSKEVLNKIKEIFLNLPNWITPGVKSWNKLSVSFENGINILSDYANSSSFRGFTMSYTLTDEAAYITGSDNGTSRFEAYLDAMLPSQSSLSKKKNIFISTANGMNSFERLYSGAKHDGIQEAEDKFSPSDKILLNSGEIITIEEFYRRKGLK